MIRLGWSFDLLRSIPLLRFLCQFAHQVRLCIRSHCLEWWFISQVELFHFELYPKTATCIAIYSLLNFGLSFCIFNPAIHRLYWHFELGTVRVCFSDFNSCFFFFYNQIWSCGGKSEAFGVVFIISYKWVAYIFRMDLHFCNSAFQDNATVV